MKKKILKMNESWYKNTLAIISILFLAVILEYVRKCKINSMFEVKDINSESSSIGSVLLIIAHPDDEIMFWTPTIKSLISNKIPMKILCLSNGNYDGLGPLREKEFDNLSRLLNFPDNQIIDIPELQDNITKKWDPSVVSEQIEEFLKNNEDVKTVLTFDSNGVTKHPNHISCYNGLKHFLNKNSNECRKRLIKVYTLDSFNFFLQYSMILPMFYTFFKRYGYFTINFFTSYKWMRYYETQFNLLRKVHVICSGYSYFNSYTKIEY